MDDMGQAFRRISNVLARILLTVEFKSLSEWKYAENDDSDEYGRVKIEVNYLGSFFCLLLGANWAPGVKHFQINKIKVN